MLGSLFPTWLFLEKNLKPQILLVLYLLAGAVNAIGHFFGLDEVTRYSKPLLMPLLMFYVYESARGRVLLTILLLCLALIFSWGGDIALLYSGQGFFVLGLGLFLLAHGVYIFLFLRGINFKIEVSVVRIIPVIIFALVFFYFLRPHIGDMMIPVILYTIIISGMAAVALLRSGRVTERSYRLVVVGSVFFIASDAMIGYSKFVATFFCSECLIMVTYIVAQYLIAEGLLDQNKYQSA